ncbi:amino acid-binding protein [Clostridia bacterium]|nr:amino acid-binding protein [Clostridia bacterium]
MILEQISVFVENRAGAVADITQTLAEAEIDIKALTLADTGDFGVLRLIVDAPKKALAVLKLAGSVASLTPVVLVSMGNEPGSVAKITRLLADAGISLEYIYAFVAREAGTAYAVLRMEDAAAGEAALSQVGYGGKVKL